MKSKWDHEIVRLLENWALWTVGGRVSSNSSFPAYNLAPPGKRAGNVMPVLAVEGERADRVITALATRYQQPLRMHYLWTMRSDRSKALACNCCVNTYKARLDEAHTRFSQGWYGSTLRIVPIVLMSMASGA